MEKKMLVDEYLDYHRQLVDKKIGDKNVVLLQNGMFYELYNYRCPDGPDLFALADLLGIQLARKNKEIAKDYGISLARVYDIKMKRRWVWLTDSIVI